MKLDKHIIKLSDEYQTFLYQHKCSSDLPDASILILHGMAEHHSRYQEFIEFLCKKNFDVFIYDHRGHGADKKWEDLGTFSTNNGYIRVVLDALEILQYINNNNRSSKLFLFGHSMGSIISRNLIQYYDSLDGVILCGTSNPPAYKSFFGLCTARLQVLLRGANYRSKIMNKILFEGHRYTKITERTKYDWLTRDNPEVGKYIHDPFCGFLCTTSFYYDLIKLTKNASITKQINKTNHDLPIYIISGTHDPVGNYGKEITVLYQTYQKLGFKNVECTLYDECRHELLNELNKNDIMNDIYHWIASKT